MKPIRKLYYKITMIAMSAFVAVSVAVAVAIGGAHGRRARTAWGIWSAASYLGASSNPLGFVITGVFALYMPISWTVFRWKRFDEIEVNLVEWDGGDRSERMAISSMVVPAGPQRAVRCKAYP